VFQRIKVPADLRKLEKNFSGLQGTSADDFSELQRMTSSDGYQTNHSSLLDGIDSW
jgi:hypothetical protein